MKRQTKMITAFILTLMLLLGAPVAAFAGTEEGTLDGGSTVEDVVMNVIVPTNLNFALDPLGLDATGQNQISTQDFFFVNQTFAPVKIDVAINAATSGGAVLVSTNSGIEKDDTSATDKNVYFGALGTTGLTGASITTTDTTVSYSAIFGSTTGPAAQYTTVSAVAETLAKFTPGTGGATGSALISFALDEAIESTVTPTAVQSLAADNDGVGAFQFYAEMNTYADWQANDVTVSGTYTITALRDTTYDTFTFVPGALNQIVVAAAAEPEPETPVTPTLTTPGFIISEGVTATTRAALAHTKTSTANWSVPFFFGDATITSIQGNDGGAGLYTIPTGEYSRDAVNNQITFLGNNTSYYIRDIAVGTRAITITLSTGAVCTFNMTQQ